MSVTTENIPLIGDFLAEKNEPFVSYNITLTVDLVLDVEIKAIKNFQKNAEFEPIHEGGLNDYVHMRRKPASQPFTFQIERYVTSGLIDHFPIGNEFALPMILWLDTYNNGGGGWSSSKAAKMFVFTGCVVMGKSYSEFNAEQSGLATETITIGYNSMYAIPNIIGMF